MDCITKQTEQEKLKRAGGKVDEENNWDRSGRLIIWKRGWEIQSMLKMLYGSESSQSICDDEHGSYQGDCMSNPSSAFSFFFFGGSGGAVSGWRMEVWIIGDWCISSKESNLRSDSSCCILFLASSFALCTLTPCTSAVPNMFRPSLVHSPGTPCGPWLPLEPMERSEILCEEAYRGPYNCAKF